MEPSDAELDLAARGQTEPGSRPGGWWRLVVAPFVVSLFIVWLVSGETAQDGSVYVWTSVIVLVVGIASAAVVGRFHGPRAGALIATGVLAAAAIELLLALVVAVTPGS